MRRDPDRGRVSWWLAPERFYLLLAVLALAGWALAWLFGWA